MVVNLWQCLSTLIPIKFIIPYILEQAATFLIFRIMPRRAYGFRLLIPYSHLRSVTSSESLYTERIGEVDGATCTSTPKSCRFILIIILWGLRLLEKPSKPHRKNRYIHLTAWK